MSQEQAAAFIERMTTDEAFRAQVMGVADETERMELIGAEGFDCSADEIKTAAAELAEGDLEGVVGGNSWGNSWGEKGLLLDF